MASSLATFLHKSLFENYAELECDVEYWVSIKILIVKSMDRTIKADKNARQVVNAYIIYLGCKNEKKTKLNEKWEMT